MRIDLVVPNHAAFGPEAVRAAPQLEEIGYGGLWFTDHVVGYQAYRPVYGSYWLEVLSIMSYAAAITSRIRIGAGVLVLPYRDAVYSAKVLSTIDVMSNGRVDVGVGTGWSRAEFHGLGRGGRFESRGAVTDEALEVMRLCWESENAQELKFDGDFAQFRKLQFEPTPLQRPHIPLWIGSRGLAKAPLRRAAKYADVWHPTGLDPAAMREGSQRLNEIAGREIPVSARMRREGMDVSRLAARVAEYRDAGCVQVAMDLQSDSAAQFLSDAGEFFDAVSDLHSGD